MKNNLWNNKNFVLTFLGTLVSNIGAVLYSFAVSFYILKITDNNSFIQGLYLAVVGIVSVVVMLFGGVLADRFNKAKIMYICDYLKGIIIAITALIMVFNNSNELAIILLFVAGITGSVVSSIFSPAASALLPAIVEKEKLQQANSYFSLLQSVQSIIGILLAGILYSILPITLLFFIVAGCYICSAISEMFIRYNYVKSKDKLTLKSTFNELGDGFSYMFKNKVLLNLMICIMFINFFFNPIFANFLPYFISSKVKTSQYLFHDIMEPEMWNSILELMSSAGMIIGSIIISQMHYKKTSTISKISLSFISLVLIFTSISYYLFVNKNNNVNAFLIIISIVFLIIGLILPLVNVPINTTMQIITEDSKRGKVNAASNVCSMGLTPLSSLLAGIVISGLGETTLIFICALGFVITTILFTTNKEISKL